jgi:hypothetical protein
MLTQITCIEVTPGSRRNHWVTESQSCSVHVSVTLLTYGENEQEKAPFEEPGRHIPDDISIAGWTNLHDAFSFW